MKKQHAEKLASAVLAYLPEYQYGKGANAIFSVPVGSVFRGMIFDSSGFSANRFYPEIFVQPLYVPEQYFTMSIGRRLLGNWESERGSEEVLAERLFKSMQREGALKLLDELSSPQSLANDLDRYVSNPQSPNMQRVVAYSFAVCEDYDRALQWLDRCRTNLLDLVVRDPIVKWYGALLAEINMFREMVLNDRGSARRQLSEWTESTRTSLKLPA